MNASPCWLVWTPRELCRGSGASRIHAYWGVVIGDMEEAWAFYVEQQKVMAEQGDGEGSAWGDTQL